MLWLWCRPIGPLAWELPCAAGAALKEKKKKELAKTKTARKKDHTWEALCATSLLTGEADQLSDALK